MHAPLATAKNEIIAMIIVVVVSLTKVVLIVAISSAVLSSICSNHCHLFSCGLPGENVASTGKLQKISGFRHSCNTYSTGRGSAISLQGGSNNTASVNKIKRIEARPYPMHG